MSLLSSVVACGARFILPISLHLKHAVAISIPTALRCVALTLYNPLSSCLSSSPVERAQWIFLLNVLKHLGILISPSNHLDKGHFELTSGISNDQSLPTFWGEKEPQDTLALGTSIEPLAVSLRLNNIIVGVQYTVCAGKSFSKFGFVNSLPTSK